MLVILMILTGCAWISVKSPDGTRFTYLNWKKLDVSYRTPEGEEFRLSSDPDPWVVMLREAYQLGLNAATKAAAP